MPLKRGYVYLLVLCISSVQGIASGLTITGRVEISQANPVSDARVTLFTEDLEIKKNTAAHRPLSSSVSNPKSLGLSEQSRRGTRSGSERKQLYSDWAGESKTLIDKSNGSPMMNEPFLLCRQEGMRMVEHGKKIDPAWEM